MDALAPGIVFASYSVDAATMFTMQNEKCDMIRKTFLCRSALFALTAGLAGFAVDASAENGPTNVTELCRPARAAPAGLTEHTIESGGRSRTFNLYVPQGYSGDRHVPLVFDLHASGITPETELKVTGLAEMAEEKGFIVVLPAAATPFPQGGATWNIPYKAPGVDDVSFVIDVLDRVNKMLCVDHTRVYATGYSGGARLASELACRMPDRFAAIGAVGGMRHPSGVEGECNNRSTIPVIAFHNTDDPVNPYQHDPAKSPPYWTYGVEEAVSRWVSRMGCAVPKQERVSANVERVTHANCVNGASIEFYRLSGTGHTWPGSRFAFPEYLGSTEHEIDATALTLQFFETHRKSREKSVVRQN